MPTDNNTDCTYRSTDLIGFWRHIAEIILDADENFSLLPRYYHKGHIRVRTNYGGACNFSLGFYDKTDSRVDPDISFEYKESEDKRYYLFTDLSDDKAFRRFVPVFNNTYRGVFEIVIEDNSYCFKDFRDMSVSPYQSDRPRQVIYFGAPGTGKSHAVNEIVATEAPGRHLRVTFHPDTDYSSFVGCFKPTMRDGHIEYSFTPQAFVNAYVNAWSDLSRPYYLVIEEINRGNCAQIFGDIFQLLDRGIDGASSYSIYPDADLQQHLSGRLSLLQNIPEEIRTGAEMRLPANLFIYATMNTSDQSLFPIDSAFKRRWDWRYTAIKATPGQHIIEIDGLRYDWASFITEVNRKIYDITRSEDKQLGYWFIKPDANGRIGWRTFVSKAIFYIWNDVVRDYATMEKPESPFGRNFAFRTFFNERGEEQSDRVIAFLDALGVEKIELPDSGDGENEEEDNSDDTHKKNRKAKNSDNSYLLDGEPIEKIGAVMRQVISRLCEQYDFNTIQSDFNRTINKTFKGIPALRVGNRNSFGSESNRWYATPLKSKDGITFYLLKEWYDKDFDKIESLVNNYQDLFPKGLQQIKSANETAD